MGRARDPDGRQEDWRRTAQGEGEDEESADNEDDLYSRYRPVR